MNTRSFKVLPFLFGAVGTHQTDVWSILQYQQVLRSRKEEKNSFTRYRGFVSTFSSFINKPTNQPTKQWNKHRNKQIKNFVKDHNLNCLFSIPVKSPGIPILDLLTLEYMLLSVSPYILQILYCQPCPSMLLGFLFPRMLKYQRELQFLTDN